MKNKYFQKVLEMKATRNSGVKSDDIYVDVAMDSGGFAVDDKRFVTTKNGDRKVLEFFECVAYISCPIGEIRVKFEPIVDAETFAYCGIKAIEDSNNFVKMVEVGLRVDDNVIRCKNGYETFCNFPLDVVEYLYNNTREENEEGICQEVWTLKEEIFERIKERMMEKDIKTYIKSRGYKELCDVDTWINVMSRNGTYLG